MMRVHLAAAVFGGAFGFLLAWARLTDPDAIRRMLLLEEGYLFLVLFSAMGVSFVGVRILRRAGATTFLTGERVSWTTSRPERRHVRGGVLFGLGWSLTSSCPGPIAAQLGQGMRWSLVTIVGIVAGIVVHAHRGRLRALDDGAMSGKGVIEYGR